MMNKDMKSNSVVERVDGPTPHGGAYYVIAKFDVGGERRAEITEYDDKDNPIFRTYGVLGDGDKGE